MSPIITQTAKAGGGSQPLTIARLPFAYNTANLLAGITVYTPSAGDVILSYLSYFSITTTFNGTTPNLFLLSQGNDPANGEFIYNNTSPTADVALGAGGHATLVPIADAGDTRNYKLLDATPVQVALTDNNGSAPGGSQGVGSVTLVILKASA